MAPGDFGKGYSKLKDLDDNLDEFEYKKLVNSIVKDIQNMYSHVNLIAKSVEQIGTSMEVPSLIGDLQRKQHFTNDLAKKIGENLKRLATMDAPSYQDQLAAEKEKTFIQLAKEQSTSGPALIEGLDQPAFEQQHAQIESELSAEDIKQREEAIRQLEQDIVGVNDIFRDLAAMIQKQGEVIDSIEANVEVAGTRIENAHVQLQKAHKFQSASRKKMAIIIFILIIIIGIIGTVIYYSLKKDQ